ncbi:hypothetical protein D3C87_1462080 [compost metagenome]
MLGTFVLAADHGVGRYVGDTYGRVGGVYVLTTGTGGTIGVDPQVCRVDFDFHLVIDLWRDEHRGERGVATVAGVERALAHQTVHADLGPQPAKRVFALDVHGRALDPGDFTGGQFHDGRVETAFVGPAQVHAQQDVGPVLGFGAAGTGLDVQVRVVRVHFMAEHAAEFQLGQIFLETGQLGDDIAHCAFVVFFNGHVQQVAAIGQTRVQFVQGIDDLRQRSALAAQFLGVFRFVPDTRIFKLAIDFSQTLMLLIVVKDTPE